MNDNLTKTCKELRAELSALHKKLEELEAKQASSNFGVFFTTRRIFSRRRIVALLPVAALLIAGGLLYGQGAGDALFIDPSGRVGIGTTNPLGKLDIQGGADSNGGSDPQALSLSYRLGGYRHWLRTRHNSIIGSGNAVDFFVNNSSTADGSKAPGAGSLHVMTLDSGNVGIGTGTAVPTAKLEVAGAVKATTLDVRGRALVQSLSVTDVSGNPYVDNWIGMTDNFPDKIKWLHIGGITDGGVDSIPKKRRLGLFADITYASGNVGIGTRDPTATLDVVGAIKATSINGEKLPLVFEVGQKGDTQKWHYVNQDIGPLCGDADGCTMKFLLRENSTDRVRTILEQIYIEQPDKSSNKTPGLYGHARQLGGGDSEFVLQTANKYEIVPHPFDWIYVRNYQSPEVGEQSPAFGGYAVQFMTKPNVSATVIIYDR